jgi:hypothetical protein
MLYRSIFPLNFKYYCKYIFIHLCKDQNSYKVQIIELDSLNISHHIVTILEQKIKIQFRKINLIFNHSIFLKFFINNHY